MFNWCKEVSVIQMAHQVGVNDVFHNFAAFSRERYEPITIDTIILPFLYGETTFPYFPLSGRCSLPGDFVSSITKALRYQHKISVTILGILHDLKNFDNSIFPNNLRTML